MEIISIRTEKLWAGPGVEALEGEIKAWDEKENKPIYIHCSVYDGVHFAVSYQSPMDYLVNGNAEDNIELELLEEYNGLGSAMGSNYIDGFILLNNLINEMVDITYGHRESIYSYIVSPIQFEEVEAESPDSEILSAKFQYKTKSMVNPVQREAIVQVDGTFVSFCGMIDENEQMVETFESEEEAERSKWFLLYQHMIEKLLGEDYREYRGY